MFLLLVLIATTGNQNMKVKSNTISTTIYSYDILPSFHDILRSPRPSVLDVNNLLCSEEEPTTTKVIDVSGTSIKTKRKRATPTQLSVLNRVFNQTFFPSTELRMELGKQLGMSPRTVQIWFQNKRQSMRTACEQPIPRHHQLQKFKTNNNIHTTPHTSPPSLSPLLACNQPVIISSPYHNQHRYDQQQMEQMSPPSSYQQHEEEPPYHNSTTLAPASNTTAII